MDEGMRTKPPDAAKECGASQPLPNGYRRQMTAVAARGPWNPSTDGDGEVLAAIVALNKTAR
jgi:hypothetical protein